MDVVVAVVVVDISREIGNSLAYHTLSNQDEMGFHRTATRSCPRPRWGKKAMIAKMETWGTVSA